MGGLMSREEQRADARATEAAILALGEQIHQMSKPQIAELLEVHPNTVRNVMRRLEIAHDSSRAKQARLPDRWTGEEILLALRLDLTMSEIGHTLGRTPESVNAVRTRVRQGDETLLRWLADEGGLSLSMHRDARAAELEILGLGGQIVGMTKVEIGRQLGFRQERVRMAMQRMGLEHDRHVTHPTMIRHGARSGWKFHRCDCDVCTEAKREYACSERVRREAGFDPSKHEHGRTEAYQAGCVCEDCAQAMRHWLVERQQRTPKTARHHAQSWTGPDVEYALREDRTIKQIAADLGRTYSAVSNVRDAVAAGKPRYLQLLNNISASHARTKNTG